ncbi:MAG: hypothetical protein NTV70_08525 [Acidobacteria bacterium]|nr:hypothetical protein [Acidobacteriota bacterium]
MGRRAVFQSVVFAAGVVLPSILIASLGATHAPFQAPLFDSRAGAGSGQWQLIHVLADGCACSNRVRAYLKQRPGIDGVRERLVPVDGASRLRLANLSMEISAAPLLIVVAPDGRVRYAGGYSQRRDAQDGFHDREILAKLSRGSAVEPLPVYGCATSRQMRARLDPFGLKALLER